MCMQLKGDCSMEKEFELPLKLTAGRSIRRGTTLTAMTQFVVAYLRLLSHIVVCSIMLCALFACVVYVVIVPTSTRDVQLIFSTILLSCFF